MARAAAIPVVSDVAGLFGWVRHGDTMIVDGDAGVVRVNPPPSLLARQRHRMGSMPPQG